MNGALGPVRQINSGALTGQPFPRLFTYNLLIELMRAVGKFMESDLTICTVAGIVKSGFLSYSCGIRPVPGQT